MRKRVIVIFAAVIALSIASLLWFIQTPVFARMAKQIAARYLPADLGIDGDFSEFKIQFFPPGVSLENPQLTVREKNALSMPAGSSVKAERMELNFRPFQMFSGSIRIHEVVIVNGEAKVILNPDDPAAAAKKKSKGLRFRWDELVNIRADGVALENTRFSIEIIKQSLSVQALARTLRISQGEPGENSPGEISDEPFYELSLDLAEIDGKFPKTWAIPSEMPEIRAFARVSAKGLQIEKLQALFATGLSLESTGTIKGDLLNPIALDLNAEIRAKGEIKDALSYLGTKGSNTKHSGRRPGDKIDAGGRFHLDAKVSGNLVTAAQTLKLSGVLSAENGHFRQWRFDQLKAEGTWNSSKDGGVIAINQGFVSTEESERRGSTKPGTGGRIEIGAFKYHLSTASQNSKEPLQIPLRLNRAHIHWLAAPDLKHVFGLQFRTTGAVNLTIDTSRDWRIRAATDLTVETFQLDNQKLGHDRPLHKVLEIPSLRLAGDVTIDGRAIRPGDLTLTLPQSAIKVGGKIDFESGYDLTASGQLNLQDIGHIAEVPIRGAGTLGARVHGPSSSVVLDFDVDIRDANYLRLDLGTLKGRITWDDGPKNLLFSAVQLHKGDTSYFGNGIIHLGTEDSVQLDFRFAKGNIQDLTNIFRELTSGLSWFPSSLRGNVNGTVKVTGGLRMDELRIDARVNGSEWDFQGENFRKVRAIGGYDKGTYQITEFEGLKKSGTLAGRISYQQHDRRIAWNLRTDNLRALDLDHFARLDVPIRGKINISSEGQGVFGSIRSETRASLTEFSVRGVPMASSEFRMNSEMDALRVSATALGGQGALELVYGFRPGTLSFFRAELQHLDFSPVLLLVNPKLANDRSLVGFVSGAINISFRSGEGERGSGRVELSEYVLAKSNASFRLVRPVSAKVTEGAFELPQIALRGPQGEATLELRSAGTRLDGTVAGEIDMSVLEFLVSPISKAAGMADLNFSLGGTLKEPIAFGRLTLKGGNIRVTALDSTIENITGVLQLKQNLITLHDIEADLAGGRLSAGGNVQIFADRFPALALKGNLAGSKLRFFPFQYAKLQGELKVSGDTIPYLVEGDVLIDSALSTEKVAQKPVEGLKAARYMPPPTSRIESNYPKFRLNIKARADRGVIIQNELFDVEAKGNFTVVNTIETPRILGTAELVQGRIIFKNRSFQIQSASAQFDNPTVINPLFVLNATTDVNNIKIQLYASGRMDQWKLELSSNPVMPESEILSLLALGLSSSDVKRLGAADRSVFEQGEGLSLLLHSLDFNREVENKTGFQIQLGDAVDSQIGSSITRPQVQTDSIAAPKIVIKRQDFLVKNLDLSAGSTLGIGDNSRREVNAEYRLAPGFSLLGVWENRESAGVEGKMSYGADLKIQRRFK